VTSLEIGGAGLAPAASGVSSSHLDDLLAKTAALLADMRAAIADEAPDVVRGLHRLASLVSVTGALAHAGDTA
jgi:hypothetical protein